ncbi:hypothetical protein Tco_0993180 [Tanacetum coccineum]|uniref:Uncharacterized protein n=1 Tax=Tanacetum coccineum TaxID=301880 RepID=A0ABQ5F461_9ASTR
MWSVILRLLQMLKLVLIRKNLQVTRILRFLMMMKNIVRKYHTVALEDRTVELDKVQAGSDPGKTLESRPLPERVLMEEDQAGSNPGQSHVVQAGPNPEPMHEDFVATVYPQVHESLKLTTKEHVHIENPPSSSRTLSSMKNLDDAFTFVPELATHVSALEKICANFNKKNKLRDKTTQAISSRVYTLENHDLYSKIDRYVNEVVKESVHKALQAPICERFIDLSEFEMKEILRDRMFESGSYISHPEHTTLYEALEASTDRENREEFNEEMTKSRKRRRDDQDPPPPSPKYSDQSKKKRNYLDASASKQPPPIDDVAIPDDVHLSDSKDTGADHLPKIKTRPDWLKPLPEKEVPKTTEPDWFIPPNDLPETENNWPDALAKTYKDPEENKLLQKTRDMGSFINWYCKQIGKSKLVKADLEGPAYKLVRPFHKNNISFQFQMEECHLLLTDQIDLLNPKGNRVVHDISKPLPLGGPPGQVTIQTQYFFNKDLEYLVSGDKERRNALSISKLKAAYYPDFRLEELVSSLWIESERDYDISGAYGISHWWFKRKEFYITRYSAPSDRNVVRSHMRILSVVSLKTFSRYGYTYLKEIVLRRADYKEYKISEADFKNLHPNDFVDLYLLHLQGKLNHLSGADKVHLFNAVNLKIRNIVPRWDATDFLFKEDYTIVHKPRAVIYRDRNNQKKMMRETGVHKFSDGTLTRILEKLDVMIKDYVLFKFNPSMEHRIWSEDDKRRSQEFIKLIERRFKIKRIFRSLESFVSGRLRDVDYRLIQRTE